jgi:hypothetical protein
MEGIADDEDDSPLLLWSFEHIEPMQGLQTRSDDGVGAAEMNEPAVQIVVIEHAPLPTVLLKVEGGHAAHTRSLVNVGGVNSVEPSPHVVKELVTICSVDDEIKTGR